MSHVNESCHMWMSHVTREWVMSHVNESCHMWMSHVIYEGVASHMHASWLIWLSHVSSWLIWLSHVSSWLIWLSHVTYECVMSRTNVLRTRPYVTQHVTYERVIPCTNMLRTRPHQTYRQWRMGVDLSKIDHDDRSWLIAMRMDRSCLIATCLIAYGQVCNEVCLMCTSP